MQNFENPYSATNIKDFWARWHISLTSWFKDYLYIPLGGNRHGKARGVINILIIFLVSGLWHGANWTFVLWGALHGIYRVVGMLTYNKRDLIYTNAGIDPASRPVRVFRTAVTFVLVSFAWIFFRANNTADLMVLLTKLFTDFGGSSFISEMGFTLTGVMILVLSYTIMILCDRSLQMSKGILHSRLYAKIKYKMYYIINYM
jgi:D-alanyl-lipoteichoic acid acyltransferase DltB (MBOAT superfamily)